MSEERSASVWVGEWMIIDCVVGDWEGVGCVVVVILCLSFSFGVSGLCVLRLQACSRIKIWKATCRSRAYSAKYVIPQLCNVKIPSFASVLRVISLEFGVYWCWLYCIMWRVQGEIVLVLLRLCVCGGGRSVIMECGIWYCCVPYNMQIRMC